MGYDWNDLLGQISHNIAIGGMSSEVSKLTPQLYELLIEGRLTRMFSKIETIRQLNYRSQINLEVDQIKAAGLWVSTEPSVKEKIESRVVTYQKEVKALAARVDSSYTSARAPYEDKDKRALVKEQIAAYKADVADFIGQIRRDLAPLPSLLTSIEQRVSMAETALDLTSMASFKLKEDEALLIALKAKNMNRKTDGILTFTNQRMIYESLPTKKTERQLLLDKPVGSVAKITKGKVGTFFPEGLLVEFKTPSDPELKFATKFCGEADLAVQYFDMIASGKIDEELKSGINVAVRRRFKELAATYFPGASFCRGRCKECGTVVSTPIKTYILDGGPIMGIFDCPKCHKPFRAVLAREKDDISAEG